MTGTASDHDGLQQLLRWAADQADNAPRPSSSDRRLPWGANAAADDPAYRAWWVAGGDRPGAPAANTEVQFVVVVSGIDASDHERRAGLAALRAQSWPRWHAVVTGGPDGASAAGARRGRTDPRVETVHPDPTVLASRIAAHADRGTYVVFVEAGDLLHPEALATLAGNLGPDVDVAYCDEDELGEDGSHRRPVFKPGWSPDLLLAHPYLGRLLAVSATLFDEATWGSIRGDYDLMLRATERARRVVHVPHVLYHRRARSARPEPPTSDAEALVAALERRKLSAVVEPGQMAGTFRVRRPVVGTPTISLVVPFRDQASLLARCVESVVSSSGEDRIELVLVDNGSVEPETAALCARLEARDSVQVVRRPGPFNWSALNNAGAAASRGELLVFLNNDIEAPAGPWLAALTEHAQRPEVGVVGPRLLYPDGTLQHAGLVLGAGVVAWHIFMGMPPDQVGYLGWDQVVRPYSAVTGACLCTRREVFDRLDGFDETLEVAFNDVDYCLRVGDLGLAVLYTPYSTLVHAEAMTRGLAGYREDGRRFLAKWSIERLRDDPYFNPNLSRFAPWCPLRAPNEDEIWERYVEDLATG